MTAILSVPRGGAERPGRLLLRLGDLAIALSALLLLAPLMLAVAIAILLESGSPVFFRQQRLGQHGREFLILKFKKFRNNVDPAGPHLTCRDDGRMTRIGAFLQKTKIDEVPQFFNVLRGDMATIGPRPESLRFADCFGGRYSDVLSYKPGILGPNQVLFRHEDALFEGRANVETFYRQILFPLKASIDLVYFSRRTFASDLRLMISAVAAVCGVKTRTEHLILERDSGRRRRRGVPQHVSPMLRPIIGRFLHRRTNQTDLDQNGAAP